jgi:hypothetical protein
LYLISICPLLFEYKNSIKCSPIFNIFCQIIGKDLTNSKPLNLPDKMLYWKKYCPVMIKIHLPWPSPFHLPLWIGRNLMLTCL